ncbi:IEC3 subunit of the Ino80 complex, chromatin re-modelling-domain-containing protein [Massariosphaeria phaeospora]|uniref:IEC3 subunit of the Ino80 complex, chromatin re-modelling-domain-containing protein n=1 Tax=Massariosphaeria phaeospora TaxID=100035 RepID=A0A7C8IA65_9PLEO|nr:IEC3 subunit of the Ino80 complex, chromatin re-modelling-domain-containing protein [Massariosphaeria phaeospora]
MATEAHTPIDGHLHAAAASDAAADSGQKGPVKRSWRRKYRKMRAQFEDTMTTSNTLIKDELRAMGLARRLQQQNDQILELLLDMGGSTRLPAHQRIDLRVRDELESVVPSREVEHDPEAVQQRLQELRTDLSNGTITADEYAHIADQLHNARPVVPRTLLALLAKVPHTYGISRLPDGLDIGEHATGYMSPTHEDEYLLATDIAMADPTLYDPDSHDNRPLRITPAQPITTDKDLTIRNPDSVYHWLRKNQPQVFLQDKEPQQPENVSEKSAARPDKASGRGKKRESALGSTPVPKTEHEVEDENFIPESGTAGVKGKRGKGGEDDSAYRPKGGSSRSAKRKREDGDPVGKGGRKKNRASAGAAN